ncbi:hypothetical protein SDC9_151696 [bioreactor metagenome]|uniref:Uncharacterized protein n=1 Tax=bioreactor metagenome TaxID=1076179 RepID=A0A645ER00_9ZZZZ
MYGGWYPSLRRVLDHRITRVASGTDDKVGTEIAYDLFCLARCGHQRFCGVEIVRDVRRLHAASEILYLYSDEIVARLSDKPTLHTLFRTNKENLRFRIFLFHHPRKRYRRIDMSGGASAGKHNVHYDHSFHRARSGKNAPG